MRKVTLLILVLIFLTGCTVGKGSGIIPPEADHSASPPLAPEDNGDDHRLLVANGLSETITLIERINGEWSVTPNVAQTGQSPNQILVRGDFCYIVNSLSNSIQVLDTGTFETIREISTGAGTNPMIMDFINDESAIVSCYLSNEAVVLDISADTSGQDRIIARIPMPSPGELPNDGDTATYARPGGLVVTGDSAYVACANLMALHTAGGPGVLVEIDVETYEIVRSWELTGRDTLSVIHSERFPERLIILSAGDHDIATGFEGNGTVESIDLTTGEMMGTIAVEGSPFGGVIGPDDILYMENGREGAVLRADLRKSLPLESFELPQYGVPLSYASSIAAMPGLLLVTNFNSDRLLVMNPGTGEVLAELATGDGPDAVAVLY